MSVKMKAKFKSFKWISTTLLILIILLPYKSKAEDIPKKDVAIYGEWTVTLNYQNLSNPTCQIWAQGHSPDMTHTGVLTIWRDYKTNKDLSDKIFVEIGIVNTKKEALTALSREPVHQFGNRQGISNGIARDQTGLLLFGIDKNNFKKLLSPSSDFFMVSTEDSLQKEILIGASLKGIIEACDQCGILK